MEQQRKVIYMDNAATSWPKPALVVDAMRDHALHFAANPGRAGHRMAADAARVVYDTREALAQLLGVGDSRNLVFTQNATEGLNIIINGLLQPGDRVVTTSMEHNSVMRPLRRQVEHNDVELSIIQTDAWGRLDLTELQRAVAKPTRLVIVNHASNIGGVILPLADVKQAIGAVPLLVDAAQTAGAFPIDVEAAGIDFLACTGHKGLLGPQGTGCLYINPELIEQVPPLMFGGTGSNSESDEMPQRMPDRYEAGTRNGTGIAGLGAAATFLMQRGIAEVRRHEVELAARLLDGLSAIPGVMVHGPTEPQDRTVTTSINIDGLSPSDAGFALDRRYGIAVRVGLHCAPMAHRTLGTFPTGTIRIAPGPLTTLDELEATVNAVGELAREAQR